MDAMEKDASCKGQEAERELRRRAAEVLARPYGGVIVPDGNGRIGVRVEVVAGSKVVHEYAYDAANRLAGVRRDGADTERYAYDEQGRRAKDWSPQRGNVGRELVYGPDDRLLRAGDVMFEYDPMGRLQRRREPGRQDLVCNYSPLGFLSGARTPSLRFIGFERDADERRTAKLVNGKKVEGYGWDRQGRLAWFYDVRSGATCWFRYAADGRLPAAMDRAGETYFLGWDHLGSLRAVVDSNGTVVKEILYDAFGNILKETNPEFRIPFGFAGGLHDRDLSMVCFRFRDYVPDVGRFSSKDPIGYKGGDADLYGYCCDDPVNGVDPSGLQEANLITLSSPLALPTWAVNLLFSNSNGRIGLSDHSALQVSDVNGKYPILIDPAGGYYFENECGSGQVCEGESASLDSYTRWAEQGGNLVQVDRIPLTQEQVNQIRERAQNMTPAQPFECARKISEILSNVGPFREMENFWPKGLRHDVLDALREDNE